MIHIVDYGVGNIQALMVTYKRMGIAAHRAKTPDELLGARRLILPGVGHFDHAMNRLNNSGMRPALEEAVVNKSIPILGICVGMQMLATSSEEGIVPGLNWIPGRVRSFASNPQAAGLPMPHMGWNEVRPSDNSSLFATERDEIMQFYFLHSYYFDAEKSSNVACSAKYGIEFSAAVEYKHIYGVQFHPEKSHHWGSQLLMKFANL